MTEANKAEKTVAYRSPFEFHKRVPVPLAELRMRYFSGKIRQKPRWWEKIHDPAIVAKWRQEMVAYDAEASWPHGPITTAQLDYVFDELRYHAEIMDKETGIYAAAVPLVYESQSLIPPQLRAALLQDVLALESVPESEKDWHPGTDQQVLDLVHPSLYFLHIDKTHVVSRSQDGLPDVHVVSEEEYMRRPELGRELEREFTSRYQWLPTDFEVSAAGEVKPLGYINNLHPVQHRSAYTTISAILQRFIPLLERTLFQPLPTNVIKTPRPYRHWYREEEERVNERMPRIPDPEPFEPPQQAPRTVFSLKGRTVQVIVKLANIVLTPEKPAYNGGAWHVEGTANERIVATGLYYYASENITESRLAFRATVGHQNPYHATYFHPQWDSPGCIAMYGFGAGHGLNQQLGHIVAEEGKCVAFPNEYQHRVEPFTLADPTRPGYRKILCFFLVDPLQRILSTSDVPPQQETWWDDDLLEAVHPSVHAGLQELPHELYEMVMQPLKDGTLSRPEAEALREEFMKSRSGLVYRQDETVFNLEFNMCKH
ncbi:hypothetical protein FKP32DRAFT_1577366 [Trametes sanguinea]|nr:hypothetical protein FKP32DRAFT_1577366 [Trametes sanguinea]